MSTQSSAHGDNTWSQLFPIPYISILSVYAISNHWCEETGFVILDTYVHAHALKCRHTHTHEHTQTHIHSCIYTFIYIHTFTHSYPHKHSHILMYKWACTYTNMHRQTHMNTCTHMHIYVYAHTHTHTTCISSIAQLLYCRGKPQRTQACSRGPTVIFRSADAQKA